MNFFLIGEYLAKLQARAWLSHALCAPGQHCYKTKIKGVLPSVSCPQTACDWMTGRKRSHSDSNQLTDKWGAGGDNITGQVTSPGL